MEGQDGGVQWAEPPGPPQPQAPTCAVPAGGCCHLRAGLGAAGVFGDLQHLNPGKSGLRLTRQVAWLRLGLQGTLGSPGPQPERWEPARRSGQGKGLCGLGCAHAC